MKRQRIVIASAVIASALAVSVVLAPKWWRQAFDVPRLYWCLAFCEAETIPVDDVIYKKASGEYAKAGLYDYVIQIKQQNRYDPKSPYAAPRITYYVGGASDGEYNVRANIWNIGIYRKIGSKICRLGADKTILCIRIG